MTARRRTRRAPSRLPRRLARWPSASATPSATSAFLRSAVPNDMEAETSSASHVTSTRSARSMRTCVSPVRAVTFHSIRRTSSPGMYGRTCASSLPAPSTDERWSPASIPSIRLPIVRSSARSSVSGSAPGPGRSGLRANSVVSGAIVKPRSPACSGRAPARSPSRSPRRGSCRRPPARRGPGS